MTDNSLIAFLSTYGPSAASDNLADENVQRSELSHGMHLAETPAPHLARIADCLLGETPTSVVLTGTAGDGKTFHIRKFLVEHLGGLPENWLGTESVIELPLPNGKRLRVIRDLTEVRPELKATEIDRVTRSLLGKEPDTLYLLAANNGQLLKFWRDAMEGSVPGSSDAADYRTVHTRLAEMLHLDETADSTGTLSILLLNLSRTEPDAVFDSLVNSVIEHENWDSGCFGCQYVEAGSKQCPIRYNRELLRGSNQAGAFRKRLKQALRIAAMNDQHVPIRQILMVTINVLLGDSKRRDRPLLTCKEAQKRARDDEYKFTNPFDNALGLNIRVEKRRLLAVFSILSAFGVGLETDNSTDALLIDGEPSDVAAALEQADKTYGSGIFGGPRNSYLRGEDLQNGNGFGAALESQRRRLFFLLDDHGDLSPWNLTVFRNAGLYLEFSEALRDRVSHKADFIDGVFGRLVKGLNRTLTGMMTEESDTLWLARSIGRGDPSDGRFTMLPEIKRKGYSPFKLETVLKPSNPRPLVLVTSRMDGMRSMPLELRPLLFEYLMRVAEGSLPSSFSRQCYQEVRHFALVVSSFVEGFLDDENDQRIRILSVAKNGAMAARDIGA